MDSSLVFFSLFVVVCWRLFGILLIMVSHLPPSLLSLFAPRPPLPYLPQPEKLKCPPYSGVSDYLDILREAKKDENDWKPVENKRQKKERKVEERAKFQSDDLQRRIKECILEVLSFFT
jgi:U1 small nuclear ribonucleoprotein